MTQGNRVNEFPVDSSARVTLPYRLWNIVREEKFEFEPWVKSTAASFEAKLPIPPSCDFFHAGNFFRLHEHWRSVCFTAHAAPIRDVFCIKGMEPLAPDFCNALDKIKGRRSLGGELNLLDYFILKEGKLPNCLLLDEAQAEASAAAMVHMSLAADGQPLPRLPMPVVLARLPEEVAESAAREIAGRAARSLWRKIERLAAGGLAAYVYWYPSVPLRVSHSRPERESAVAMCEGWINLAARLLRAGFLPTSAYSINRGHCCDPRNAVIDGGFADLGSIVPAGDIPADEDVFIALQITMSRLAGTIHQALGIQKNRIGQFDYTANMIMHQACDRLARACSASGDPRLVRFSGAVADLNAVVQLLGPA